MFQLGAFGDPREPETRILLWSKLELLRYPGAGDTKEFLEKQAQTRNGEATHSGE